MYPQRIFPFLRWFPMSREQVRSDIIAGVTVALVLVPQSMAYAQLAGLPVVYGLYASFLPVVVAALWGSLNQLHTGPVAMLALMSAAAVMPFATPGTPDFIAISIMLALMVGVLRLALGLLRLGVIVNLLSSPVVIGFTNAAALIIGLSMLNKVLGVPFPRSDSYLADLWQVVLQLPETHWPTLAFAVGTWILIHYSARISRQVPGVLIAVVVATLISAAVGYEQKVRVPLERVADPTLRALIGELRASEGRVDALSARLADLNAERRAARSLSGSGAAATRATIDAERTVIEHELRDLESRGDALRIALNARPVGGLRGPDGALTLVPLRPEPGVAAPVESVDDQRWRFAGYAGDLVSFSAGGAVVGDIPRGLPPFSIPEIKPSLMLALLPAALVMALIGFMEATSISKAIAAATRQRVDANQELIGQGLANIVGSFFSSFTVSGSFSRSAVAARSGARTGLFAIVSVIGVVLALLFLTPYLYHLPQATLAVIVMMAVLGLIRVRPLVQAWRVERQSAIIGILTFFATLLWAPQLANGILLGVALTVLWCLVRTMRPRAEIVARKSDGTLGGIRGHGLAPMSRRFVPVRFDGALTFINVAYFEDVILEAIADFPDARAILVIGSGINEIDASGEEKVRDLARRLREMGVALAFSGLKQQVWRVFERGGLIELLGEESFFADKERAIQTLLDRWEGPGAATVGTGEPPSDRAATPARLA